MVVLSASRATIGVVVVFGVTLSTFLSLFVVPAFYLWLAPYTRSPEEKSRELEQLEHAVPPSKPDMAAPATIDVRHEPEHSRFVASVDGVDSVVRYRIDGGVMHVLSTNVPPALEGRGIAAALNEAAIARRHGARSLAIDPVCSYTAAYLRAPVLTRAALNAARMPVSVSSSRSCRRTGDWRSEQGSPCVFARRGSRSCRTRCVRVRC